jgi:hypothetical protein
MDPSLLTSAFIRPRLKITTAYENARDWSKVRFIYQMILNNPTANNTINIAYLFEVIISAHFFDELTFAKFSLVG